MVEAEIHGLGSTINESNGNTSGIEAKRERIQFARANAGETGQAFGGNRSPTERRSRKRITEDRQTTVAISDNRPEVSKEVKGKPPKEPAEDTKEEPKRRGRPPKVIYPDLVDSTNQAKLILSAVEIGAV